MGFASGFRTTIFALAALAAACLPLLARALPKLRDGSLAFEATRVTA